MALVWKLPLELLRMLQLEVNVFLDLCALCLNLFFGHATGLLSIFESWLVLSV